jgi:hypothetical protein
MPALACPKVKEQGCGAKNSMRTPARVDWYVGVHASACGSQCSAAAGQPSGHDQIPSAQSANRNSPTHGVCSKQPNWSRKSQDPASAGASPSELSGSWRPVTSTVDVPSSGRVDASRPGVRSCSLLEPVDVSTPPHAASDPVTMKLASTLARNQVKSPRSILRLCATGVPAKRPRDFGPIFSKSSSRTAQDGTTSCVMKARGVRRQLASEFRVGAPSSRPPCRSRKNPFTWRSSAAARSAEG